jgi:hypothetical protein
MKLKAILRPNMLAQVPQLTVILMMALDYMGM